MKLKLAKWLKKVLTPFIPQNNSFKDSVDFVESLQSFECNEDVHMSSLDVVSLLLAFLRKV